MTLSDLLGAQLMGKDGSVETASIDAGMCPHCGIRGKESTRTRACSHAEYVGLYFAAGWCPPCKELTPILAEFYNTHKVAKKLEIVFVSSDRDQAAFDKHYSEMPWLALPFADRTRDEQLTSQFNVQGTPTLVIIDKNGVVTKDASGNIEDDTKAADFPWRRDVDDSSSDESEEDLETAVAALLPDLPEEEIQRLVEEYEEANEESSDGLTESDEEDKEESEEDDDDELDIESKAIEIAFLEWLPDALLKAHDSKALKAQARKLLGSDECQDLEGVANVWEDLKKKLGKHMADLGDSLRCIYERDDLRSQLGSYPAEIRPASKRQDCEGGVPLPPGLAQGERNEGMSEFDERCFIHYLRLIALAVDPAFQDAVNLCLNPGGNNDGDIFGGDDDEKSNDGDASSLIEGGQTFHGGIKGFERMANKMISREDHRYDAKPRPCQNVDINRCLAVAANADKMVAVLDALQQRFGAFAKFKNGMALSDKEATDIYHLRLCMVSVLFEHPTLATFRELCADEGVQERWRAFAEEEAPESVSRERWDREVARALEWLHSDALANKPVRMVCEVQCLLATYRDIRMDMHEVYKAYRAENALSLKGTLRVACRVGC